jgi:hypothetical protein
MKVVYEVCIRTGLILDLDETTQPELGVSDDLSQVP